MAAETGFGLHHFLSSIKFEKPENGRLHQIENWKFHQIVLDPIGSFLKFERPENVRLDQITLW